MRRPFFDSVHSMITMGALVFSLGLTACDSEDDFSNIQSGLVSATPETLLFPSVPVGQEAIQELSLRNVGSAPISLVNIRLSRAEAPFDIRLQTGDPLPDTIVLEADETSSEILQVIYRPTEGSSVSPTDEVIIETNSTQQRELRVPIRSSDAIPDLFVSPNSLDFGSVDAGETSELVATIRNVGQGPLLINSLYIDGSEDFALIIDDEVSSEESFEAITIDAGSAKEVTVRYAPPSTGPDRGDLVILSNDPQASSFSLPLRANGAAPCIQLTPSNLDFGSALLVADREAETPNTLPLIIESCGGAPLKISRIEFEGAEFGLNSILEPNEQGDLIELPATSAGEAFPSEALEVGFWPVAEQNYGGRLLLYTNTQVDPIPVDLFGRGVENSCPIPVASTELYEVAPLDIITLDGSPSADPGGEVKRWVWNVIERPSGSVSQVVENLFRS